MGAEPTTSGLERINAGKWLTGAGAGAVGAVAGSLVLFALGAFELADVTVEALGILVMPGAVFGLVYAGIASIDAIAARATEPRTGVLVGLGYGGLFWVTTIIGDSITASGLLAALTFGVVLGLLYAVSPYPE